jgi:hypothetical protein
MGWMASIADLRIDLEVAMRPLLSRLTKKLLLSERQLEWAAKYTPFGLIALPIFILQIKFLRPEWAFGGLTLLCLFMFAPCGLAFEDWDSRPGVWIRAMLYLSCLCSAYWVLWFWIWMPTIKSFLGQDPRLALGWRELKLSIDTAISLNFLQYQIRYALTVLVENLRRTGDKLIEIS